MQIKWPVSLLLSAQNTSKAATACFLAHNCSLSWPALWRGGSREYTYAMSTAFRNGSGLRANVGFLMADVAANLGALPPSLVCTQFEFSGGS